MWCTNRGLTRVIYVDPTTGALCHTGKLGHDIFSTEDQALGYITNGSRWMCRSTVYARAILGYAALGSVGLLLVATKLTTSIPNLPGGGCVYTVSESQWIKILLQNPQLQGKGELKNIQDLTDLDIDGKHYFCETRDITRPFPSRMCLQEPDEEFVWNGWFSKPFKNIGLPQHCVVLLQGFAEFRTFGSSGQEEGIVALIARQTAPSCYIGLSEVCFWTGNEVEYSNLCGFLGGLGGKCSFQHIYCGGVGTIPIWWGAELKITAAEAEIYVSDRDPYKGSSQYYQRLSRRYDTRDLEMLLLEQIREKFFCSRCAFCPRSHQNGVIPFNCADSLDRTNAAAIFAPPRPQHGHIHVQIKLGRDLTCPLKSSKDQRFYHRVSQLADLFLLAGDIHATLYTGSEAMHSQILSIFNEETGKFKQLSVAKNMKIMIQRRIKNVVVDSSVRSSWRCFWEWKLFKHLPTVLVQPLHVPPLYVFLPN
ncbi:SAC domain [Dillenia turbinata]|uniref:SAC domain n=1 Tax=Dillenia turbinata TaxID=194707 RepID=A0AAN8UFH4_9MAGN